MNKFYTRYFLFMQNPDAPYIFILFLIMIPLSFAGIYCLVGKH